MKKLVILMVSLAIALTTVGVDAEAKAFQEIILSRQTVTYVATAETAREIGVDKLSIVININATNGAWSAVPPVQSDKVQALYAETKKFPVNFERGGGADRQPEYFLESILTRANLKSYYSLIGPPDGLYSGKMLETAWFVFPPQIKLGQKNEPRFIIVRTRGNKLGAAVKQPNGSFRLRP